MPEEERPIAILGEDFSSLAEKKKQIDLEYKEAFNACKGIRERVC